MIAAVERQELDKARDACDTGYLRFALSSVRKALAASEWQEERTTVPTRLLSGGKY